ncbi:MAG: tetratricopeptide repeat protein [Chloroflexota bacterium]|jgi:DNA-binding SARP family transcriptional activator/predicted ATPase
MPAPLLGLTLFGQFEARYADRPLTGFATDKVRALLAYLAIESGKPHRRETLAGLLWPDYPDETARSNLRKSIYRLRQTLHEGDSSLPERLISQSRQTVTLHPEAIALDTARFDQLVSAARTTTEPMILFSQISALYQGELLRGFSIPDAYAFEEWLTIQREVFHQTAVDSLTHLLSLYESANDPEGVLAAAVRLLALDPWHERTHRQIMRAQRQKGNRPGAIAQYKELRAILHRDLGVEPSQATTTLYEQIRAEITSAGEAYSPAAPSQLQHFPVLPTPLIGRRTELDYLTRTLLDPTCRLLSLTGPGGTGKTRLCIETARRLAAGSNHFDDGLVFIPLAQVQESALLISAIAQSLNLFFRADADPYKELLNYLKNRRFLLVLDNFEHLLGQEPGEKTPLAISFLVDTLASAPGVTLFVTSRDPLNLQSEWVFGLEGLPYLSRNGDGHEDPLDHPAPQLFIQSARRLRPAFDPRVHAGAILEICRLTDGLPLALEIAAAWMRAYDPQEIAEHITQSLDFLTSPYRDTPTRQRSIRAVITSAWNQLTPDQQNALAATAVFQGEFAVQSALSVARTSVLDLAALVEKSLLRRARERRYVLHELVRAFAAEMLAKSGDEQNVRDRHADFYFSLLSEQLPGLSGPNPQEAIVLIKQAMDDLRAAWKWAVSHAQLTHLKQGMYGIAQFLILMGSNREGEESFERALNAIRQSAANSGESLSVQSQLLANLAWFQSGLGKNQVALKNAEDAVAVADQAHDRVSRAHGLSILGWTLQVLGRFDESVDALSEAVTIFNQNDRPLRASLALIRLGSVYWRKRDFEKTVAYYQQSLEIEERLQNKRGINRATGGIGLVYVHLDKYDEALVWLNKALDLDRELGNRFGVARHLGNLGTLYLALGDYPQALALYQEAAQIDRALGNKSTLAIWLGSIGNVYKQTADDELALDHYDQAIAMYQDLGDRFNLCEALLGKAEVYMSRGDVASARPLIEQGRQVADEVQRKEIQFRGRLLQGRLLAKTGCKDEAYQILSAMLSDLDDGERSEGAAQIYYELWRIENEVQYARAALSAYRLAAARVAKAEYRTRTEELSDYLAIQENPS